jgi:hypothetical protein
MYFNRRVLATVAIISNYGIAEAGNCPQSVVNAASDAEFLKFALLNCIPTTVPGVGQAGTNRLGKATLDPQTCLATFMNNSKLSFGSAECLNTYSGFVRDIVADITGLNSSPFQAPTGAGATNYDACQYDSTNDRILVSYVCWNKLSKFLTSFQQSAGYPIVTNACDGSFVRSQALSKTLQDVVSKTLKAVSDGLAAALLYKPVDYRLLASGPDGTSHIVVGKWAKNTAGDYKANGVDLDLAMCYGAYQTIFDLLQGNTVMGITLPPLGVGSFGTLIAGPTGWQSGGLAMTALQTACQADITSGICAGSQLMSGLKSLFNNLSGYDIDFTGPLCSADTVSKLNSSPLTPTPYQFFVMCGLMSSKYTSQCSADSVSQYVASLNSTVGIECNGCYNEMYSSIQALITNSTATSVCNSLENVTSAACVASMAPVAAAYKSCTGVDLYTKIPSSIPSSNSSGSNSTSNGTASNDAASSRVINSGMIVLIAVLTYLM